MKKSFKPNVYLFNLLFLFYTLIGPVKAFYHFLSNSSDLSNLSQIEYIVKVRLSKKYIHKKETSIKVIKKENLSSFTDWIFFHNKNIECFNELINLKINLSIKLFFLHQNHIPFYLLFKICGSRILI
jgi:hypothetical protein